MDLRRRGAGKSVDHTTWYRITLSAAEVKARHHERIRLAFNRTYMILGQPRGMGLWFARRDDDGADVLVCTGNRAKPTELLHRFSAVHVTRPPEPRQLLAGDEDGPGGSDAVGLSVPLTPHRRLHLPAALKYRTVRDLDQMTSYPNHELAPFVRRYLDVWFPSRRPCPGGAHKGING